MNYDIASVAGYWTGYTTGFVGICHSAMSIELSKAYASWQCQGTTATASGAMAVQTA